MFVPCIQNQEEYLLHVSVGTPAQYLSAYLYLVTSSQAMITLKMKSPAGIPSTKEGRKISGPPIYCSFPVLSHWDYSGNQKLISINKTDDQWSAPWSPVLFYQAVL